MNTIVQPGPSFEQKNTDKMMTRKVLIFGLVLGAVLCANMFYMVDRCYNSEHFRSNDVLGYAVMVVVFSLTFFGTLSYRNNELNGIISFGKAFRTGALIALAGATMYVVVWLFYYYLSVPDFLDKYIGHVLREAAEKSPAELAAKTKEMAEFKEMYKNPIFVVLITYFEVLPVGLIVALVGALILKRKNKVANA
jgi:NADH:ubiquinone oxidoreductase subunit 6 (subunit J)